MEADYLAILFDGLLHLSLVQANEASAGPSWRALFSNVTEKTILIWFRLRRL
jgi:hypothetical protein